MRTGDRNIDIDAALSYFDERIQDVLGHYQKDFEGGVSVENLGARFGGYGSFLPAYQRSPSIWSHPRTPQKVQNNSTSRSPHNQRREVVHQNTTAVSSETRALSPRLASSVAKQVVHQNTITVSSETRVLSPRLASSSAPPLPASRTSSVDRLAKFQNSKECVPKDEPVNLPINQFDQKTLKVRIKVSSESLLAQKNAAIYSGLGLDMSPSSSSEDSPAEWKGNFLNIKILCVNLPPALLR
ncbi:hypothetical protein L1049_021328 [Liquidambar formosana]|uniref:Uncharacterized protein n=1 Tax=Liquidambar formosana TaxID=63359 RepID=A0AAP0X6U9_LIQFO